MSNAPSNAPEYNLIEDFQSDYIAENLDNLDNTPTLKDDASTLDGNDLRNFDIQNTSKIFQEGFIKAREYAKSNGLYIKYERSGGAARGLGLPKVRAIEVQTITATPLSGGQKIEIGTILPEKKHLTLLKTPDEIYEEIKKMIDDYVNKSK